MIKNIFRLFIVISIFALSSCSGDKEVDHDIHIPDNLMETTNQEIDKEKLNEFIQGFPSPVETAALIQDLEIPFSKKYLASTNHAENYDTNFKKAIGLGVYSADLGYLNVYNRTTQSAGYLAIIKSISDDLNVGQFFDFQTLKRLASNNDNIDSLMFLSVHSFHQMDEHLRRNNRSNLSALVVTGVWIEGLFLATQILVDNPSQQLRENVGEQKVILESLSYIIKTYSEMDNNFNELYKDIQLFEKAFEVVKIEIVEGEDSTVMINGIPVLIPGEQSRVIMSEEGLQNIIKTTEQIRNKLIAL